MKRLLDTNICIYIIKQKPSEVRQRFDSFIPSDIGVSSVTVAELTYGAWKSQHPERNQRAVEQFVLPLLVVDFDFAAALIYGHIRGQLESQGTPVGSMDLLIAAQALQLGIPVVTNNVREFTRVPGLRVENWFER